MITPKRLQLLVAAMIAIAVASTAIVGQSAPAKDADVDRLFAKWTTISPGCTVGASVGGKVVLAKAYGMADLEHDVKNTPDTIFEAGSVSKQFTAAAVLLLAREGKLSLDDPARKYIPELPDYGAPLTIRHMLNHTSGLRDWGSVAGIAGWPRTSRAHTHAHVLDILSRQRALNFPSGTRYSYSNSGYNLAAMIVARVSGKPFADFTRERIFQPLGMTRTSWRDDYRHIVKHRAIAYSEEKEGYRTLMPFENVHGNGGLLTTVGDLLTWNHNFASHVVGDRAFADEQATPGKFNDGRVHQYALGLMVGPYKGVRQVAHSGSTAGYQAYLTRYPDQQVSVAVLCNANSAQPTEYARAVADIYLADRITSPVPPKATHALTASETDAVVGLYRDTLTGEPLTLIRSADGIRIERGATLVAQSASRFLTATGLTWEFAGGRARATDAFGTVDTYERVKPAQPTAAQLQELAGTYVSDDAETTMAVAIDGGALVLKRRPDTTIRLTPIYPDAFSGQQFGTVIFRRDGGRVTAFSVVQDRVWDLRFTRQVSAPSTAQ